MWKRRSPPVIRSTTMYLAGDVSACLTPGDHGDHTSIPHPGSCIASCIEMDGSDAQAFVVRGSYSVRFPTVPLSCVRTAIDTLEKQSGLPSSFLMYFKANVRPVSFLSTILTFPNAPLPTTRRSRKWSRFTERCQRCPRLMRRIFNRYLDVSAVG